MSAIEEAPLADGDCRSVNRLWKAHQHAAGLLDPDLLSDVMREQLQLLAEGYTDGEIAERMQWSVWTVKDRTKALLAVFFARNRTHLAALAVARGYVKMPNGESGL